MRVLAAILSVSASLHVTVWPHGQGIGATSRTWTLRCSPVGGTLPHRVAACRKLAGLKNPFAPVPPGTVCSLIYSGPQTALVTGTFRGQRISARFNRRNGCETARWARLRFLFPVPLNAPE